MEVKGEALKIMPIFIKEKFGDEKYNLWFASLSLESKAIFKSQIFSTEWYSLRDGMIDPTKLLCDLFYGGDMKGAWECGRFSADHALRGIYKVFVRIGSPEYIISKAASIFSNYYKNSSIKVENASPKAVYVRITSFPEMDRVVEYRIGGWIERALEISGCKNVRVTIRKSLTYKEDCTEYFISWGLLNN